MKELRRHVAPGGAKASDREGQEALVKAIAGEYMGSNKRRGRVYTWLPLHATRCAGSLAPTGRGETLGKGRDD